MKKLVIIAGILLGFAQQNLVKAVDDVYDAPQPKKVRVKQTYTEPTQPAQPVEKTVPYYDEDNTSSRVQSSNVDRANNYDNRDESQYSDDYAVSSFGYTDRIRRFHNPNIQFNYGWNNWNNNFYDPWNNNGWNNWNNFSFTPSWTYGYNNFYNPFWGNTQVIIVQPGFNSWYNNGFYNPYNSFYGNSFGWNNFGWNNFGWNGFSPYCSNVIYNNGFSNFGSYYDGNRKNIVYGPRTNSYGNSNRNGNTNSNTTKNYYNNGSTNTNSGNWNVNNNNTQQNTTTKSTNTNNNNPQKNTGSWSNPYKNNNAPTNNNNNNNGWKSNNNNNYSSPAPSPGSGTGGVKIGTRPK